jgi:replicative DNA helicase
MKLPHDEIAERSYLATLSAPGNEDEAFLSLSLTTPQDFLVPGHKAWHRALGKLVESRSEINVITIWNAMDGDTERPSRFAFDNWVMAEEVGRPSVLADIIKRHALSRKLMAIGHHLEKEASSTTDPVGLGGRVQDAIRALETGSQNTRIRLGDVVNRVALKEALGPGDSGKGILHWSIPDWDMAIEGAPGHVVVLAARPKCGKSAMLVQVSVQAAKHEIPTLIVSLEMDGDEVSSRIASHLTGRDHLDYRRGSYGDNDVEILAQNQPLLDRLQTWVGSSGTPMSRLEAEIRDCVRRDGVRLVCVDYLQLVAANPGKGETLAAAIGRVSQGFKRLAQELRICILLLSQVNREGGKSAEPGIEDLKGSGDIEQDANAIVMLWRNNKEELQGKIAANRSGPAGYKQALDFDGATSTFKSGGRIVDGATVPTLGQTKAQALLEKHKPRPVGFMEGFM